MSFGEVITAMVTPFNKKLELDLERACELANYLVNRGSDGLVLAGTTGESPTLTYEEEFNLFKEVKKAVGKKVKIIAGTGSNSTETTINSTKVAEKIGVDACLVVAPYYNKPPQHALYNHYAEIAKNTSLPIIIYNIPGRTGVNISAEILVKLSQIKNIVGLKDSTGNLEQVSWVKKNAPKNFLIYSGDDVLTLPLLSVGAEGVISVASHLIGKEIKKLIVSFKKGKIKEALSMHLKYLPLFKVIFITTNPIPIKSALKIVGLDCGGVRLPLVLASPEEEKKIMQVMASYGLKKNKKNN